MFNCSIFGSGVYLYKEGKPAEGPSCLPPIEAVKLPEKPKPRELAEKLGVPLFEFFEKKLQQSRELFKIQYRPTADAELMEAIPTVVSTKIRRSKDGKKLQLDIAPVYGKMSVEHRIYPSAEERQKGAKGFVSGFDVSKAILRFRFSLDLDDPSSIEFDALGPDEDAIVIDGVEHSVTASSADEYGEEDAKAQAEGRKNKFDASVQRTLKAKKNETVFGSSSDVDVREQFTDVYMFFLSRASQLLGFAPILGNMDGTNTSEYVREFGEDSMEPGEVLPWLYRAVQLKCSQNDRKKIQDEVE